jgi:hypothetical protein
MKSFKLVSGLLLCAILLAATSSFAQAGRPGRPGRPGMGPNPVPPPSSQKSYSTAKNYTTLALSNANVGDVVKYTVSVNGKAEAQQILRVEAGQTSASKAICRDDAKGLRIGYTSSNAKARVSFFDADKCPAAADGSNPTSTSSDKQAKASKAKAPAGASKPATNSKK